MVRDGWYLCPCCGKHVQRVEADSIIVGTPLNCRRCKVDWYPSIYLGRELGADEPIDEEIIEQRALRAPDAIGSNG